MKGELKIGDQVNWRGSWGRDYSKPVKIVNIERETRGGKYVKRKRVLWRNCQDRRIVVDLDNGHWAYGFQIEPILPQKIN